MRSVRSKADGFLIQITPTAADVVPPLAMSEWLQNTEWTTSWNHRHTPESAPGSAVNTSRTAWSSRRVVSQE